MVEGYSFRMFALGLYRSNREDTRTPNAGTRVIRMATAGELHLAVAGDLSDPNTLVAENSWRKTRSKVSCICSQVFQGLTIL